MIAGFVFISLLTIVQIDEATDVSVFQGPMIPTDQLAGPVFEQATACSLDPASLQMADETYRSEPETAQDKALLDDKVNQLAEQSGLGSDPAKNRVSRDFIREMLIVRMRMTLTYSQTATAEGRACLEAWLGQQGFQKVSNAESNAIPDVQND